MRDYEVSDVSWTPNRKTSFTDSEGAKLLSSKEFSVAFNDAHDDFKKLSPDVDPLADPEGSNHQ